MTFLNFKLCSNLQPCRCILSLQETSLGYRFLRTQLFVSPDSNTRHYVIPIPSVSLCRVKYLN